MRDALAALVFARCSGVTMTSFAALSSSMYWSSAGLSIVLHGTTIAPRPITASMATIISGQSLITSATRSPCFTPSAASAPRARALRSSSSPEVTLFSFEMTAAVRGCLRAFTVKALSRRAAGQIMYTPMVNEAGKVAIEGLTLRLAEDEFIFTQSAGLKWLEFLREKSGLKVELADVTPDYTCYALQGPKSTEVLEALTKEKWRDLRFSRFRKAQILGIETIVARQGVTGEVGYEFMMRTESGRAHELWRRIREVGSEFGLRELGFKAQMIGHTETGIPTVIRDFLPARGSPEQLKRMMSHWMAADEFAAIDWVIAEQLCSPAELGWAHTVNLQKKTFHGRDALAREADACG